MSQEVGEMGSVFGWIGKSLLWRLGLVKDSTAGCFSSEYCDCVYNTVQLYAIQLEH